MKYSTKSGLVVELERTPCRHYRMRTMTSKWVRVKKSTVNHVKNTCQPVREIQLTMADMRKLML